MGGKETKPEYFSVSTDIKDQYVVEQINQHPPLNPYCCPHGCYLTWKNFDCQIIGTCIICQAAV